MPRQTLMFVDDDEKILSSISSVLQKQGYRVLTAPNGPEALMLVDQYQGPIDLVVSDIIMPGIKGNDLALYLRNKRPEAKIIFMSGYGDDVLEEHEIDKEGFVFLHKPFSLDVLLESIRTVLLNS